MKNLRTNTDIIKKSIFILCLRLIYIQVFFAVINFSSTSLFEVFPILNQSSFGITSLLRFSNIIITVHTTMYWSKDVYIIHPHKLIHKKGICFTQSKMYAIKNIESIEVRQNIIQKLGGFGNIILNAYTIDSTLYLRNIPNPLKHSKIIEILLPKAPKNNFNHKPPIFNVSNVYKE